MASRSYLPSAQFLVIVGALVVSGGAVAAARHYTTSQNASAALSAGAAAAQDDEWQQSLAQIQAQSGATLPEAPSPDAIQTLLTQAQSDNLTDSIGRQLLVKLTAAGVQGLGSDIPTQDTIVAEATAQINASQKVVAPPAPNLVEPSEYTLRLYGNAVMQTFAKHPKANMSDTYVTIAKATDTSDPAPLLGLPAIGKEYGALADDLGGVAVPKTLAPLHSQVVGNLLSIAATYPDMAQVVADPLRGAAALQRYQLLMGETGRVLTNIAEALNKGGILFTKDEPGSAWDTFLSAP